MPAAQPIVRGFRLQVFFAINVWSPMLIFPSLFTSNMGSESEEGGIISTPRFARSVWSPTLSFAVPRLCPSPPARRRSRRRRCPPESRNCSSRGLCHSGSATVVAWCSMQSLRPSKSPSAKG